MKKLDTLKKELENISNEELSNIINNNNVELDSLSEHEKLSVLMYRELSKAINNKKYNLLLDCNYSNSKNEILLVDYYRLAVANSMIQVYVRRNSFRICTSASKSNREKFSQLENELHFVTKYDKKTNRAKTTERINISYDDIVSVIKQVIAILEDTTKQDSENESNEE
jgi:hypothetical protein